MTVIAQQIADRTVIVPAIVIAVKTVIAVEIATALAIVIAVEIVTAQIVTVKVGFGNGVVISSPKSRLRFGPWIGVCTRCEYSLEIR